MSSTGGSSSPHVLQCMDIWSGNQSVENEASTPAVDIFVYSQPYRGQATGGDVHYVSLCAGGIVTRLILADISGHGAAVSNASQALRSLMRRFMNAKKQSRLVRDLNREFTLLEQEGRFATAIVTTYLSHRRQLSICNAGHPRPLWHRRQSGIWAYLDAGAEVTAAQHNLPLGIDESAQYRQFDLPVEHGDCLVLYTDAVIESRGAEGQLLGESGLLQLIQDLPAEDSGNCGRQLLDRLRQFSAGQPTEDDLTILVLKFSTPNRRRPGLGEKLNAYAKMLRLKPV